MTQIRTLPQRKPIANRLLEHFANSRRVGEMPERLHFIENKPLFASGSAPDTDWRTDL